MRSLNCTLSRPSMHKQELIPAADRLRKPERIKLSWQEHLIPWYTKPDVQKKPPVKFSLSVRPTRPARSLAAPHCAEIKSFGLNVR